MTVAVSMSLRRRLGKTNSYLLMAGKLLVPRLPIYEIDGEKGWQRCIETEEKELNSRNRQTSLFNPMSLDACWWVGPRTQS